MHRHTAAHLFSTLCIYVCMFISSPWLHSNSRTQWIRFKEILSTVLLKHAASCLSKRLSVCTHTSVCFLKIVEQFLKLYLWSWEITKKKTRLKAGTPSKPHNQTLSHTHLLGCSWGRSIHTHKKKSAVQAHVSWCNLWVGSWADASEGSSSRCMALGALHNPPSEYWALTHTYRTHKQGTTKSPLWAVNSSDWNSLHD